MTEEGNTTNHRGQKRARIAAAFRAAKGHLWDGSDDDFQKPVYICFALDRTARRHSPTAAVRQAKEVVMSRISPETVLSDWVLENVRPGAHKMTYANMQLYRHRWLDALIEEFST